MRAAALLPTRTNIRPSAPEDAEFFDPDQVAYILKDGNKIRCATSYGELGAAWALGTHHEVRHDQTQGYLGYFTVVGIVNFATGESTGEVPTKKVPHWVFK